VEKELGTRDPPYIGSQDLIPNFDLHTRTAMTLHNPNTPVPIRNGDLPYTMREPHRARGRTEPKFTIIYKTTTEKTPAQYGVFPDSVPYDVDQVLMQGGRRPYIHQAEAAQLFLDDRKNVALITPTASGKTVSFLAPTLTLLQKHPASTAMMIYPMNALASDQLKVLRSMGFKEAKNGLFELSLGDTTIRAGVLNGDSTEKHRRSIRTQANLVITNHAALHFTVLAQSGRQYKDGSSWNRYLVGLKTLVLDEGHSYNGVDGTNAALAFRRLSLLTYNLSGGYPQVLMSSATIGNPLEHAENLTGLGDWALVNRSGAASHMREVYVISPDLHPSGRGKWAASTIAADIAMQEVEHGRRVLIFCASRNGTEKLADRLNDELGPWVAVPFHAGIPAQSKRTILKQILDGKAKVVCATSALELGVDIGGMDTVILVGHPGDHASFNQRIGRVGRTAPGWVYLILDENQHPLNNYLEGTPEAIHWEPECRTIYPGNRIVANRHAACAFLETKDADLVHQAFPTVRDEEVQAAMNDRPHSRIAMVGLGNFGQFKALTPDGTVIQELGGETALLNWHVGATIRSSIGQFFRVERIDIKHQSVFTAPETGRVYTTPTIITMKKPLPGTLVPLEGLPIPGMINALAGEFDVQRITTTYTEARQHMDAPDQVQAFAINSEDLNPPIGIMTRGVVFSFKDEHPLAEAILETSGGIMAVQDALGLSLSLLVQARAKDVPVEITQDDGALVFFIFDMAEGGMGWADQLVYKLDKWLVHAGKALLNCACGLMGCPRCSLSPIRGESRKRLAEGMIAAGSVELGCQ